MKKPVNTAPITIVARQKRMGRLWKAESSEWPGKSATAEAGPGFAAHNLAKRWFFGGCTYAQGVGREEAEAIECRALGGSRYEATLKPQAGRAS